MFFFIVTSILTLVIRRGFYSTIFSPIIFAALANLAPLSRYVYARTLQSCHRQIVYYVLYNCFQYLRTVVLHYGVLLLKNLECGSYSMRSACRSIVVGVTY